jgi:osmotically-inducible protein OsmY
MQWRTTCFGLVICLVLAVVVVGCAGDRTSRSTGQYVDDSVIANKVKVALYADEQVKGRQIEVEAHKGTIQLSGFVNSTAEAQRAVQIARNVEGVREVRNSLIVK